MPTERELARARIRAQKYLTDLTKIHENPAKSIRRAKIYKITAYLLSALLLFLVLAFYNVLPELLKYALVCFSGILVTFSHFFDESARNINLLIRVIDWDKVKRLKKSNRA